MRGDSSLLADPTRAGLGQSDDKLKTRPALLHRLQTFNPKQIFFAPDTQQQRGLIIRRQTASNHRHDGCDASAGGDKYLLFGMFRLHDKKTASRAYSHLSADRQTSKQGRGLAA